jgi:glycosyltransferase involved in cell wall biosynthesis
VPRQETNVTSPLLSVIIPTWNRAHVICDAVESALMQRPGAIEVLVVDDGSTDGTAELLTGRFGTAVTLLRRGQRGGPGAARNAGIRLATGEFVAFLDSDDLFLPGKLDAELRALEQFPRAEGLVSDSLNHLEERPEAQSRFAQNGLLAASRGETRWIDQCRWLWTNSGNGVATCSMTIRRATLLSMIERTGQPAFAEDIGSSEDWEFEMRFYYLCRVLVLPEVLAHVRRFDDGARPGRAAPGTVPTIEQRRGMLRDQLTVIDRAHWLVGLDPYLASELERCRGRLAAELALPVPNLQGHPARSPVPAG